MRTRSSLTVKTVALLCALLMVLGLFAGCNAQCNHMYVNGVCSVCNSECPHVTYLNGVCTECGTVCEHDYNKNGECKTCGIECVHEEYENGICEECGYVCEHAEYVNGVCKECSEKCLHLYYADGVCTECNTVCAHAEYEGGICKECGTPCIHEYGADNKCKYCGTDKTPDKDPDTDPEPDPGPGKDPDPDVPENPAPKYDYVPHVSERLARIDVTSADADNKFSETDAVRYVPSFDNNNPANNIDWQYHACTVSVSDWEGEDLTATAGIKVRGNWTTTYPKKPFRIKFDKKQSMLGLNGGEKFKSWVLLADYKDFSLERNSVALYLGNQILGSDGYYCSDFRQVELYLDGTYWGVYLLVEQQQVNKNRIDVTEPAEGYLGTDIGYFIEYDGYYNLEVYNERFSCNYSQLGALTAKNGNSVYPYQNGFAIKNDVYENTEFEDFGPDNWNPLRYPQKTFIRDYMFKLYSLCYNAVNNNRYYAFDNGFTELVSYSPVTDNPVYETVSRVIDVQSLVDMYIHCEIVCDFDLGWSSFFMDVDFGADAQNNLLRFEAPWDFDSAFGLRYACDSGTGLYAANAENPWLLLFINEDWFSDMVKAKWRSMKEADVQSGALALVRQLESYYSADEYADNINRWGFNISDEATWEIKNTVGNHTDAANQLYGWLSTRFDYLDSVWL